MTCLCSRFEDVAVSCRIKLQIQTSVKANEKALHFHWLNVILTLDKKLIVSYTRQAVEKN